MTKTENNILLFSITLCWSASYIFIKNLPEDFSSYAYLTMTTGIAAVLMTAIFWKKMHTIQKRTWIKGFFLSVLLSLNLLAEKKGILYLVPSDASFLSSLTIIIVPVLLLFFHHKPTKNHVLGAGIILLGLCVGSGFKINIFHNKGSLYMLAGCVCSAVYTIAVERYSKEENPVLLCIVQMIFTALLGFVLWYKEEPLTFWNIHYTKELLSNIFVLAFFTKAYAYIVLMYSQRYTDAISVTVIASMEPVVTLLLALVLPAAYGGNYAFNVASALGAVIITLGAVVAGLQFLSGGERNAGEN